ncbi:MAG: MerR family transcriptional regulator [Chloroflexi bacterium]|nr:MerR family transcriptional regulator [Chloroflexota bacterium]
MRDGMTIGRLAQQVRVQPKTIRYYEQIGLLPRPGRTPAGYRIYSEEMARRLEIIRRLRLLGLSLAEVKTFAGVLLDDSCAAFQHRLKDVVADKVAEVSQRIAELTELREALERLATGLAVSEDAVQGEAILHCHDCQCLAMSEGGEGDGVYPEGDGGQEAAGRATRGDEGQGV